MKSGRRSCMHYSAGC